MGKTTIAGIQEAGRYKAAHPTTRRTLQTVQNMNTTKLRINQSFIRNVRPCRTVKRFFQHPARG